METSRALRILAATAVVSALAILLTSPAQARPVNEGDAVSVVDSNVGNAVAGAQAPSPQLGEAAATSSGSDGFDRRTFIIIAGGVVLVLGAAALLVTPRQRGVTLS